MACKQCGCFPCLLLTASSEALRKMSLRHQIQNEIRRKEIRDESRAVLEAEMISTHPDALARREAGLE
jgi:hypothetical protein